MRGISVFSWRVWLSAVTHTDFTKLVNSGVFVYWNVYFRLRGPLGPLRSQAQQMNHLCWKAFWAGLRLTFPLELMGGDLIQWTPSSALSMEAPSASPSLLSAPLGLLLFATVADRRSVQGWWVHRWPRTVFLNYWNPLPHKTADVGFSPVPFTRRAETCALLPGCFFAWNSENPSSHLIIFQVSHDALVGHMFWWRLTWLRITVREWFDCCSCLCCS